MGIALQAGIRPTAHLPTRGCTRGGPAGKGDPRNTELLREAVQTIVAPGLRLVHETTVSRVFSMKFSPDGRILAVHHAKGDYGGEAGAITLWMMPSGQLLGETPLTYFKGVAVSIDSNYPAGLSSFYNAPFALSPNTSLVAIGAIRDSSPRSKLRLWDANRCEDVGEIDGLPWGPIVFSPERLARCG